MENTQTTVETVNRTEEGQESKNGSERKLIYNIITLCLCVFMLALQVYALVLLSFGGASLDGTSVNGAGVTSIINLIIATGTDFLLNLIPKSMILASLVIASAVFAIIILVKLIKSIIKLIKFFSLGRTYEEQIQNFKAFKKDSYKSLYLTFFYFMFTLILGCTLNASAVTFFVLSGVTALLTGVFEILFPEGDFKFELKETLLALGERLVTLFLASVLFCAIYAEGSSMYVVLNNLVTFIVNGDLLFTTGSQKIAWICSIFVLPFIWLILNILLLALALTLLFGAPVVNIKKIKPEQLNGHGSRAGLITALVFSLIAYIFACVVSNMAGAAAFGDYMRILPYYITAILATVGGIVLNPLKSIMLEVKKDCAQLLK